MRFQQRKLGFVLLFAIGIILPALLYTTASAQIKVPPTATAAGADVSTPQVYRSDAVILVHSDLVLIPVTVTDHRGKAISGLEKEDFTLFENAAPQQITHFAAEDAPGTIGIVFDTSGSMRPKMSKAIEAVNALLDQAHPEDEFFFVNFSSEARLTVPLTRRVEDVRNRLASLRATGTTALLDALRLAIAEMEHAHTSRKAIVIVSDGEDNSSLWTVAQVKRAVREREIVIYSIGLPSGSGERSQCQPGLPCGGALLRDISRQTGGRMFEVNRVEQLPSIASAIGGWLRHQYLLGYIPSNVEKDGAYRKIDLKIERPKGFPKMNAVWRHGYYAPKE
jgi:Ca-activated chloride channel family protein